MERKLPPIGAAVVLLELLLLAGCAEEGAARAGSPAGREVVASVPRGAPVEVDLSPGDVAALSAPAIPVHPRFRGARIEEEHDPAFLRLRSRGRDLSRLGAASEALRYEALRAGTTEVRLRLADSGGETVREYRYVVRIADG
jgi:hypothetical protein